MGLRFVDWRCFPLLQDMFNVILERPGFRLFRVFVMGESKAANECSAEIGVSKSATAGENHFAVAWAEVWTNRLG